jgi:hypothetical protein
MLEHEDLFPQILNSRYSPNRQSFFELFPSLSLSLDRMADPRPATASSLRLFNISVASTKAAAFPLKCSARSEALLAGDGPAPPAGLGSLDGFSSLKLDARFLLAMIGSPVVSASDCSTRCSGPPFELPSTGDGRRMRFSGNGLDDGA